MAMLRKLGKLDPKYDARTFNMARYVKPLVPPPPSTVGFYTSVPSWAMLKNDVIDNCTCAAAGHQIQAWSASAGNLYVPTDDQVLKAYYAIRGWNPWHGVTVLDTLNYWRKVGVGGHKITAFMKFPIKLPEVGWHFKNAIWVFGGALIGLQLPLTAWAQTGPGLAWQVPADGPINSGAPGTWGGHCVAALEYDIHGITCISWGAVQRASWQFLTTYCDEAYAILSSDWVDVGKVSPSSFDYDTLVADLATV